MPNRQKQPQPLYVRLVRFLVLSFFEAVESTVSMAGPACSAPEAGCWSLVPVFMCGLAIEAILYSRSISEKIIDIK